MKNHAFTLIELLVVVLIIGILTAIALPQYQKAVAKTKYTQLKIHVQALAQTEKVYHLANGVYAPSLNDLDIQLPWERVTDYSGSSFGYFGDENCSIDSAGYVACRSTAIVPGEEIAYGLDIESNIRLCYTYTMNASSSGNKICQSETGQSSPKENEDNFSYTYTN